MRRQISKEECLDLFRRVAAEHGDDAQSQLTWFQKNTHTSHFISRLQPGEYADVLDFVDAHWQIEIELVQKAHQAAKTAASKGEWQPITQDFVQQDDASGLTLEIKSPGNFFVLHDKNMRIWANLQDQVRLCQFVTRERLSAPTGPGWWAWKGYFSAFPERKCQEVCRVSEAGDGSLIAQGIDITWPTEHMIGEWQLIEIDWS